MLRIPLLGLLLALWTAPPPAVHLGGRVIRLAGADSLAVPALRVVLHRVTPGRQGPVDSMLTDATGRFRFTVRPDSGEIYLASARWGGVEYFGVPVPAAVLATDQELTLVVSDTSSSTPLGLVARQIVVVAPATDGTREVVDAYTLANPGQQTRVVDGAGNAAWRFLLPPGVIAPRVDDSDFALEAFTQRGDTVLLHAAIPPGKHSILVSYQVPAHARNLVFPSLEAPGGVTIMAQEEGLTPEGLTRGERRDLDGKHFTEWSGAATTAGAVVVALPWDGSAPPWLLTAMVVLVGAVLAGAGVVAVRRRRPVAVVVALASRSLPVGAEELLRRIAALDAAPPAASDPEARRRHAAERAALKETLTRLLREGDEKAPPPRG